MEEHIEPDMNMPPSGPLNLPNSTAVLILGILSIVLCFCYGIIGIILGVIALILAKKDKDLYLANPEDYTESSYKNLNAGRICAFVGIGLSVVYMAYIAYIFATVGEEILREMPWDEF